MASVHKRQTKGGVVYDVRYRDMTGAGRHKSFLGLAVRSGAIGANPVDGTKIPSGPKAEHRYLTSAELEALCREITSSPQHPSRPYDGERPDLGLLVRFAAFTGLRLGENLALKVRDVDLVGELVTVRQSVAEVRGKIHIGETKTGERRSVPIAASLLEPLAEQIHGRGRDEFVWPDRTGRPLR